MAFMMLSASLPPKGAVMPDPNQTGEDTLPPICYAIVMYPCTSSCGNCGADVDPYEHEHCPNCNTEFKYAAAGAADGELYIAERERQISGQLSGRRKQLEFIGSAVRTPVYTLLKQWRPR
jgi:hypothetical protein